MLSDAEKAAYHAALEKVEGDKTAAAAILNVPPDVFRQNLYNCKDLRLRWTKKRTDAPPTVNETLNRKALATVDGSAIEPIQSPEVAEALAVAADKRLAEGISNIPPAILTTQERQLAESLHGFHLRHHAATAEIVGGSIAVTSIKMTAALNELIAEYARLTDGSNGPEHFEGGGKNSAALILEAIPKFAAELRKLAEIVGKANLAKALLALKSKQGNNPGAKRKPGFAPLVAVKVEAGGNVTVGGKDGK